MTTIIILCLLMTYVFFGIKSLFVKTNYHTLFVISYVLLIGLFVFGFFTSFDVFKSKAITRTPMTNLLIGFTIAFFVFNFIMAIFLLFDDLLRIIEYVYRFTSSLYKNSNQKVPLHSRRSFIQKAGLLVAGIPFASMIYGITRGKYNYTVKNVKLAFKNLPKAFEGFKVLQISDIHSGSFDSVAAVKCGVDLINQQDADIVLFTGDLVNYDANEIVPYITTFKQIKSKYGKFSTLGNHDYAIYNHHWSDKEKNENMSLLFDYHKQMDFDLLNNENRSIEKDGEKINIIGVENWGSKRFFPQKGDLDKAMKGALDDSFKILMSHDPTHWDRKVIDHKTPFELTLSGHTHGMQFGIDIPGFIKWSPVKYFYPRWAGLYKEKNQYLYVNRGFGFLGFPGRVGMSPEITVIELTREA